MSFSGSQAASQPRTQGRSTASSKKAAGRRLRHLATRRTLPAPPGAAVTPIRRCQPPWLDRRAARAARVSCRVISSGGASRRSSGSSIGSMSFCGLVRRTPRGRLTGAVRPGARSCWHHRPPWPQPSDAAALERPVGRLRRVKPGSAFRFGADRCIQLRPFHCT